MKKTTEQRFWAKVAEAGNICECWLWVGAGRTYGTFWDGRRNEKAHRYAYRVVKGDIPAGLAIDHLCSNTLCVNPYHLEAVSQRENVLRSSSPSSVNAAKTHCPQGHPYAGDNLYVAPTGRQCVTCKNEALRRFYAKRKAAWEAMNVQ